MTICKKQRHRNNKRENIRIAQMSRNHCCVFHQRFFNSILWKNEVKCIWFIKNLLIEKCLWFETWHHWNDMKFSFGPNFEDFCYIHPIPPFICHMLYQINEIVCMITPKWNNISTFYRLENKSMEDAVSIFMYIYNTNRRPYLLGSKGKRVLRQLWVSF